MKIGGTLVPELVSVVGIEVGVGVVVKVPFAKSTMSCWNAGDSELDGSGAVGVAGGGSATSIL